MNRNNININNIITIKVRAKKINLQKHEVNALNKHICDYSAKRTTNNSSALLLS
jgi:hypothetical protein